MDAGEGFPFHITDSAFFVSDLLRTNWAAGEWRIHRHGITEKLHCDPVFVSSWVSSFSNETPSQYVFILAKRSADSLSCSEYNRTLELT